MVRASATVNAFGEKIDFFIVLKSYKKWRFSTETNVIYTIVEHICISKPFNYLLFLLHIEQNSDDLLYTDGGCN